MDKSGRAMASRRGQSGARREPVFDSGPELRVAASQRPGASGPGKSSSKRSNRRPRKHARKRSLIGRAIYWSLVLGLWVGIGAAGTIASVSYTHLTLPTNREV